MAEKELFRRGKGFDFGRDRENGEPEFVVTEEKAGVLQFWIDLDGYDNNAPWDMPRADVRALRDALTAWLGDGAHAAEFTGSISSEGIEVDGSRLDSMQMTVVPFYDEPATAHTCGGPSFARGEVTFATPDEAALYQEGLRLQQEREDVCPGCQADRSGGEWVPYDRCLSKDDAERAARRILSGFGPSDDGQSFLRKKREE